MWAKTTCKELLSLWLEEDLNVLRHLYTWKVTTNQRSGKVNFHMERRYFIKKFITTLATVPLLSKVWHEPFLPVPDLAYGAAKSQDQGNSWESIRNKFLLKPGLIYLNCGSLGPSPRPVVDAVCSAMFKLEGNPAHEYWGEMDRAVETVRARVAELVRANGDEIALIRNTTEGMNAVATGLKLKAGDEVLTSNHEHGGGMMCWQHLAKHFGAKVICLEIPNPVRNKEQIVQLVEDHITPNTRVCSFSHVDTITGMQMPLADIARITRPKGIVLVCDGAQALGMLNVDVKALGVDTYAASGHKWLLGPKGTGILYIRKEIQERIQPVLLHSGYKAYSASVGTRGFPQFLGLGAAIDLQNAIGRKRVETRCRELGLLLRERLQLTPALQLITPEESEMSSGIVTFAVDKKIGNSNHIINKLYKSHNIAAKKAQCTYSCVSGDDFYRKNYNALRFSTHIFNSEAEIEQTAAILSDLLV